MILPKGDLIGIFRGKPLDFLDRVRNGYLRVSWKDPEDIYSSSIVLKDGNPIMADLELVKSRRVLKGKEAFEVVKDVDYGVVEVYSLDSREVSRLISMNDESYLIIEKAEEVEKVEEVKEVEELHVENFEDFILSIGEFSGVVEGFGEDRVATIYIKDGDLVGARVRVNGNEFLGVSALYYLEFPARVVMREGDVSIDENCKVQIVTDREKLMERLGIRLDEKEIDEVLNVLNELKFEERRRFFDKISKFFRRR